MTGSTGYLKAGSRTTLTVTGLHAGDQLCLRGSGTKAQQTSTGSQTSYTVTLASGTADREYIVRDGDGHYDKTTLKVLGNKTLSLGRSATRVKRSGYLTVTVRGLASGEATLVTYAGRTVRSTKASTSGTVTARFAVGRSLGTKTVRAYGQFSDIRRGSTTFTVVR